MKRNKTAAGVWLTGAALVLALFCPLPVLAAARVTAAIPATVRTEGADSAAICTVELTPLDNAPAPAQCRLTVKNGGTAYFTGLDFDAPGDYRYRVAELKGSAANTSYDAGVYTVTVRVTSKKDGTLASRIRPTLAEGSIVTDTRVNTMYVVTEYGCVNLKGLSSWERAEALISIAHPDFREELIQAAQKQKIWYHSNKR